MFSGRSCFLVHRRGRGFLPHPPTFPLRASEQELPRPSSTPERAGVPGCLGRAADTPFQDRDDIASVAWLLERNDLTPRSNRAVVPDEDPLNGNDVVTTYARRFKKSQNTPGVTSRGTVMWFELDGHTHALSTLDHYNDMCDNLTGAGPGMTPCNVNPNASKDFYTSLANLAFFEQFAGLMK